MQNLMSDISFEWLLEFLLTMFFFVQNSIHIEETSITRLYTFFCVKQNLHVLY